MGASCSINSICCDNALSLMAISPSISLPVVVVVAPAAAEALLPAKREGSAVATTLLLLLLLTLAAFTELLAMATTKGVLL